MKNLTKNLTPTEHHIAADLCGVLHALARQGVNPERVGARLAELLKHKAPGDTATHMRRMTDPITEVVAQVEVAAGNIEAADNADTGGRLPLAPIATPVAAFSQDTQDYIARHRKPLAVLGNGDYRTVIGGGA